MLPRLAGIVGYCLLLQYSYVTFTATQFAYLGFRARPTSDVDAFVYAVAIGLVALASLALPRTIKRPSDFVLWGVYVLSVIPTVTIPHYSAIVSQSQAIELSLSVLVFFLVAVLCVRFGPRLHLRVRNVDARLVWLTVMLFSTVTYAYLGSTVGLRFDIVGLTDVRDLRLDFRSTVASATALGYLLVLQAYVINPLVMIKGLLSGRWVLFGFGTLGQVLLYSAAGHKMAILSPVAVLLVAMAFRVKRRMPGAALLYGVLTIVFATVIFDHLRPGANLSIIFVQRLLTIPGALTSAYYSIFDGQPKANFSFVSGIGSFSQSNYSETPAFHVGRVFNGNAEISANANFFADGFANGGFFGMFVEAMVFVVILILLDATLRNVPMPVAASILALPTLSLCNVSAFTAVLSQGFGLVMLLGMFLPRTGWANRSKGLKSEPSPVMPRIHRSEATGTSAR